MFLSARSGAVLLGLMIIGAAQPGGTAERTRRPVRIGAVEVTDRFWALRVGESRQGEMAVWIRTR